MNHIAEIQVWVLIKKKKETKQENGNAKNEMEEREKM